MPTKKRDSQSPWSLNKDTEPALSNCYRFAVREICGVPVRVKQKDYSKFYARMSQLNEIGESYDTYAYTVVKGWWPWCKKQGWNTVSVGIFCGPKAWERFTETRKHVRIDSPIDTDWNILVHNELAAARIYIGAMLRSMPVSIHQAREVLKAEKDPSNEVVAEVISLLGLAYSIRGPESYDDVFTVIRSRKAIDLKTRGIRQIDKMSMRKAILDMMDRTS